jgi:hypothetical protein
VARIQRQDGAPDGTSGGPVALRMLLGAHLRRLCEAQGVSREEAGWEIRASESKISRMELGRVGFKERDVADLLTLHEVDDDQERVRLLALAREANNPGWWHRYGDVLLGARVAETAGCRPFRRDGSPPGRETPGWPGPPRGRRA